MTDNAIILIPDISGYTDFLTKTELAHSSHIVTELLDLIVASNTLDFTLSKIEGDALLFYRKGTPAALDSLVSQCLLMFENFHKQLKIIERDTVCHCGACQTASKLTLKFVLHYGTLKEVQIARSTEITGVDVIIAHRLLKNAIGAAEYILTTQNYLEHLSDRTLPSSLTWQLGRDDYPAVGTIAYHYASLEEFKNAIPEPPKRESPIMELGQNSIEVAIDTSLFDAYQKLIDLDSRVKWMIGLQTMERDEVTERIGVRHVCRFEGMAIDLVTVSSPVTHDQMTYREEGKIRGLEIPYRNTYRLTSLGKGKSLLTVNVEMAERAGAKEFVQQFMGGFKIMLERFKQFCESEPPWVQV